MQSSPQPPQLTPDPYFQVGGRPDATNNPPISRSIPKSQRPRIVPHPVPVLLHRNNCYPLLQRRQRRQPNTPLRYHQTRNIRRAPAEQSEVPMHRGPKRFSILTPHCLSTLNLAYRLYRCLNARCHWRIDIDLFFRCMQRNNQRISCLLVPSF